MQPIEPAAAALRCGPQAVYSRGWRSRSIRAITAPSGGAESLPSGEKRSAFYGDSYLAECAARFCPAELADRHSQRVTRDRSHLRQRQCRGRKQVFDSELAIDDALLECIAADRRQFATIGLDAVGPEILTHQAARPAQLLDRPRQRGEEMADRFQLAIADLLGLQVGDIGVHGQPGMLFEQ